MSLQLPVRSVVVLLGPAARRAAVLAALDPDSARCAGGHAALGVGRVTAGAGDGVPARLRTLAAAAGQAVVLVDRLTDGLGTSDRRTVLAALATLAAAGHTVLVDDADPVAALAVAQAALRVPETGRPHLETALDDLAVPAG
ncbi:hypothetical protein O2W14_19040 [Modestobacter sp. VKM Ac-2986]|uniref:hypothetical protein n=1 Tax=Modestobacter sp. VKM Ac-2986 TaxID=3004140 RepID=UPI0022ABBA1D|nr:hypothetical protein [Modestobacter sp. VKM Ac-2986]MCZ2830942.1 hypothetical protein [Modestobacter sp. VKM Ac-2986]